MPHPFGPALRETVEQVEGTNHVQKRRSGRKERVPLVRNPAVWCDSALGASDVPPVTHVNIVLKSRAVYPTMEISRAYGIRVGPITPMTPVTSPIVYVEVTALHA